MENILTNLLSNIVAGANNIIDWLLNNLIDICFYAEKTMFKADVTGVSLTIDNLKTVILTFSISLIILKFLKKGFDIYVLWTERRGRTSNRNICNVFCKSYRYSNFI